MAVATTEPPTRLQIRLLFHLSHRLNDENKLMMYHQKLQDSVEDQLSLAAIHSLRGHYQEAIDIYKRILLENRYVRLCFVLSLAGSCSCVGAVFV